MGRLLASSDGYGRYLVAKDADHDRLRTGAGLDDRQMSFHTRKGRESLYILRATDIKILKPGYRRGRADSRS